MSARMEGRHGGVGEMERRRPAGSARGGRASGGGDNGGERTGRARGVDLTGGRGEGGERAAARQPGGRGRGAARRGENEKKNRRNRSNPRGKDLWSRFQPRTGTKDPLVAVGNTNRDQRSPRAAKKCARSPAGLWSRLVLPTATKGFFFLFLF